MKNYKRKWVNSTDTGQLQSGAKILRLFVFEAFFFNLTNFYSCTSTFYWLFPPPSHSMLSRSSWANPLASYWYYNIDLGRWRGENAECLEFLYLIVAMNILQLTEMHVWWLLLENMIETFLFARNRSIID